MCPGPIQHAPERARSHVMPGRDSRRVREGFSDLPAEPRHEPRRGQDPTTIKGTPPNAVESRFRWAAAGPRYTVTLSPERDRPRVWPLSQSLAGWHEIVGYLVRGACRRRSRGTDGDATRSAAWGVHALRENEAGRVGGFAKEENLNALLAARRSCGSTSLASRANGRRRAPSNRAERALERAPAEVVVVRAALDPNGVDPHLRVRLRVLRGQHVSVRSSRRDTADRRTSTRSPRDRSSP
jgi:hypothetical protein